MEAMYLALLEDEENVIIRPSIELIQAITEPIKYIVEKQFCQRVKWGMNEIDLFTYNAVDVDGSYKNIELSNFVIIDLGTDSPGKYVTERKILVKEKHSGITKEFYSNSNDKYFLVFDLMKLIRLLNNTGSFETLAVYEELEKLKKENKQLVGRVNELERANKGSEV